MNARSAALAMAIVAATAALAVPRIVQANVITSGGASALCKAASGPGAGVFYFDTLYALNTSAGTQYLTCHIPSVSSNASAPIVELVVHYSNPTNASQTFTCVVQGLHAGANDTQSSVYTRTLAAGLTHDATFWNSSSTPLLPSHDGFGFYTMSCAIPAGTRLDSIQVTYAGTIGP